jgi:LacI family transcriptional regulator
MSTGVDQPVLRKKSGPLRNASVDFSGCSPYDSNMRKTRLRNDNIRVAFVVPDLHVSMLRMLTGISNYAKVNKNWHLRIAQGDSATIVPKLREAGIDGAIMKPSDKTKMLPDDFAAMIPCVSHSNIIVPRVAPYITADNVGVGRLAAEHFLGLGLRSFAYFSTTTVWWSQQRLQGYADRLREAGFQPHVYAGSGRAYPTMDWQPGRTWVRGAMHNTINWLRSLPKPVGLMTCTDPMGYDLIEASEEAGIRIPEEVAVVGIYNERFICEVARPPLSSVEVNIEKAGYRAAELLNDIILGRTSMNGQVIFSEATHVVQRQSSEMTAVDDPEVSAALHFIRNHFHQPIQVVDVVSATGLSRRMLEIRFSKSVKRSILDEVLRLRVEHVANILITSDLSIEQIATASNFESAGYMARLFKKFMGMSPRDYRRKQHPHLDREGGGG